MCLRGLKIRLVWIKKIKGQKLKVKNEVNKFAFLLNLRNLFFKEGCQFWFGKVFVSCRMGILHGYLVDWE
jgi:hypothetical protein